LRLLFLGSGRFAIPSLEAVLDAGHEVLAAVTQPDREKGRGQVLTPPPLKPAAEARGLPVLQPRRIREPAAVESLRALRPDLLVVVAYGQILPKAVLEMAPRGAVNVHGSLLPRWRGAAPIQWAIASGDPETGVTTMQLDEGMDTGPVLLAEATSIGETETAPALEERLSRTGARLLVDTLRGLVDGSVASRPQDARLATHARILQKEDGRVDWSRPAREIDARRRGFDPWPGAFTTFQGRGLKLRNAAVEPAAGEATVGEPGRVLSVGPDGIVVACGGPSRLRLLEVQPESRSAMPAPAFASGARIRPGDGFA
jgi:methionyl-tRNA formyltransferase